MDAFTLPKSLQDEVVQHIDKALTTSGLKVDFCKIWPTAKPILEALKSIPVLAIVVGVILAAGNAYYGSHCK